jgi:hypothetical protein
MSEQDRCAVAKLEHQLGIIALQIVPYAFTDTSKPHLPLACIKSSLSAADGSRGRDAPASKRKSLTSQHRRCMLRLAGEALSASLEMNVLRGLTQGAWSRRTAQGSTTSMKFLIELLYKGDTRKAFSDFKRWFPGSYVSENGFFNALRNVSSINH